ncbi:MAG: DNA polymerase I [Oscillospiraceae bacterium]|nr:DNA polymerase I [Oscillospiraceae bacterium]
MRLLVIDGNSIVNRAFYGIKLLTTKDGRFTNGIYGFLSILIKLREECSPDRAAIAFDLKEPTFRHKMYDGYKAGRHAMPAELASQMPVLKQLLGYLGYTIVEKAGYEADDILGTLSAHVTGEDKCFIATGDRDSLQLVSDNTTVLLASTKMGKAVTTHYDREKLMEDYGVEPKQMIEIKALMGDSSDNIPGVAGVGQKTAGDLIKRFSNIDYIYAHLDELDIKKGVHDKLEAGKDSAYLSRKLGTICLDAPIDCDFEHYKIKDADAFNSINMLVGLEMFEMIEKLGLSSEKAAAKAPKEEKKTTVSLTEEQDLPKLLGELHNMKKAFFISLFENGKLRGLIFNMGDSLRLVSGDRFDFDSFTDQFVSGDAEKYTSDIKQLYKYCFEKGFELKNAAFDTSLAGYILNPSANDYSVGRLSKEYSVTDGRNIECPEKLLEKAEDCEILPKLCEKLGCLIEENGQHELLYDIELPLSEVLASMETEGFLVDRDGISEFSKVLDAKIEDVVKRIFAQTNFEFNLNSPKQLGAALFETLGIPCKKKTKSGYSTSADVLEELAGDYPVVADVLEYRMLAKLKSTYCDGLLKVIGSDGRIHSTFNQTETRTGRISSQDPNLQNIPVRSELGRELRKFFISGGGSVLLDADYSQIELRVLAHVSQDKNMIEAFNSGQDIHRITASQVFNMPPQMVTPLMRTRAKAVNFGIVYGIGAFSLAKDIGVTRKEADAYIKGYLKNFSGVDEYMKNIVSKAREDGFVSTLFGRRRYLPELSSSNKMLQAFGERVARNMPIQGTAADIIKIAMVRVYNRLKSENMRSKLIMQVHDELIVEAAEDEKEKAAAILGEEMRNACKMSVELIADVGEGKTWFDAH